MAQTAAVEPIPEGFLSAGELAKIFGCARQTIVDIAEGIDAEQEHVEGRRRYFDPPTIHRLLVQKALDVERNRRSRQLTIEGVDTKEELDLERIRKLRLENEEREGSLVEFADAEATIMKAAHAIRKLGSKLARKSSVSGRDVQMMINRALEKVQKEMDDV